MLAFGRRWRIAQNYLMKIIHDQPLMSTLEDSQGEKSSRAFLEDIVSRMPQRFPLGRHHDNTLRSCGYIENYRLTEIPDHPGEWRIIGDVFLNDDVEDGFDFGGFSFSAAEIAKQSVGEKLGALYVPYPLYRDESLMEEILTYDKGLAAGRWIKKEAQPLDIDLIVCLVLFVVAPIWDQIYKEKVWPFLSRVREGYFQGRLKNRSFDLGFTVKDTNDRKVNILLVPDRKDVRATTNENLIQAALGNAITHLATDPDAKEKGVSLIKLYFEPASVSYQIFWIQYLDGTVIHPLAEK